MFLGSRNVKSLVMLICALGVFSSRHGIAQDKNEEALAMVTSAMDAYSNLEMDRAKAILENALTLEDELDGKTLAKIHTSLGIISISGFSDTPLGQNHFIQAACYDEDAKVDPLYSTPEIDLIFTQSKEAATVEKCDEFGLAKDGAGPKIVPCGTFAPLERQRRSYELPFYVEVSSELRNRVVSMVVHYSFDSGRYSDLDLPPRDDGYGAMLECDLHDIRRSDPSEVTYYIEGFSRDGEVVCGYGTDEYPLMVEMAEDAPLLPSVAGMKPEQCFQCSDDDEACKRKLMEKMRGDKREGAPCTSDMECVVDLICDPELFVCGKERPLEEPKLGKGPGTFYVNLTAGAGTGYVNKALEIRKATLPEPGSNENYDPRKLIGQKYPDDYDDPKGQIITVKDNNAKGFSWSGVPVRLAVGYHITPKLSIELSGRVDVFVVTNSVPVSCLDAAGGDIELMKLEARQGLCRSSFDGNYTEDELRTMGGSAISMQHVEGDEYKLNLKKKYQLAWLVNARVRFRYLTAGAFVASLFGGIGYGAIQYRVLDTASNEHYFPMPGMVDIELGLGFAFYFNDHVGLLLDIPLDVIVGDGFAFNIDFNLGVGVGF
jgi:hypothetical protein